MEDLLKKSIKVAEGMLDSVVSVIGKMDSGIVTGQEVVGKAGEISVAVTPGGTGEVLVSLGKSLQAFPARAVDGQASFKRGDTVRIAVSGTTYVQVEALVQAASTAGKAEQKPADSPQAVAADAGPQKKGGNKSKKGR